MRTAKKHPAKYTDRFLPTFAELLTGRRNVLDPYAGTCKLARIQEHGFAGTVYCNELELEWAAQGEGRCVVTVGDAEHLPYSSQYFDAVCTSPTYGNRLADKHRARDASRRRSYTHDLGRQLTDGNTGGMQWGQKYQDKSARVWGECARVLELRGLLILNISDHIRNGEVVPVTSWHIATLESLGFGVMEHRRIETPRLRYGANSTARVDHESIVVFQLNTHHLRLAI